MVNLGLIVRFFPSYNSLRLRPFSAPVKVLKPRERVVDNFVGREDILQAMHQTHFINAALNRDGPIITVLAGMGGIGKTQLASKFASQVEKEYDFPLTSD